MGDRWKTLLLVTLVAGMIWVFAEGESLRTQRVSLRIAFAPGEGQAQLVRPSDTWTGQVIVEIEGATSAIGRFEELAREPITLRAGQNFSPDGGEIDLRTVLRAYPGFRRSGIAFVNADPSSVRVWVDDLERFELPVRVEVARGEVSGSPRADPARVTLLIPESARSRYSREAVVTALVRAEQTATLVPGREERLAAVDLVLPESLRDVPGVEIIPPQVGVTLTLRHTTAEYLVPNVPVHIRTAPKRLAEYEIEIAPESEFLRNVKVRGPRDVIARIESREINVIAYVSLSHDELEAGITEKQASFGDFPGPLEFEVERAVVSLTIRRRPKPNGADIPSPPPG